MEPHNGKEINKNKINLKVDGRTIECNVETPYMTNRMELMIPISVISDAFNCAKNVYNGKEILIEKVVTKLLYILVRRILNLMKIITK